MSTFDYQVNLISSKSVRIYFSEPVVDLEALILSNYELFYVSLGVFLPVVVEIKRYVNDYRQYEVIFEKDLTYNGTYSMIIDNISSQSGKSVNNSAHNFQSSLSSGPKVIGAFPSIRGRIDILFDRPVNEYSSAPSAILNDGTISYPLAHIAYDNIMSNDIVRFSAPFLMFSPYSDSWSLSFSDIMDESLNSASGIVNISIANNVPRPLISNSLYACRLIDARVISVEPNYEVMNIRLYFNMPLNSSSTNPLNYSVIQTGSHSAQDSVNTITAPVATDLPSLIILLNQLKLNFNAHIAFPQLHKEDDLENIITTADATDLISCGNLLSSLIQSYNSHRYSEVFHHSRDASNSLITNSFSPSSLVDLMNVSNDLRDKYDFHLSNNYIMELVSFDILGPVTSDLSVSEYGTVNSDHFFSVDIRVKGNTTNADLDILALVTSSDGASNTNFSTGLRRIGPVSQNIRVLSHNIRNLSSSSILLDQNISINQSTSTIRSSTLAHQVTLESDIEYSSLFYLIQECMVQLNNHRVLQNHSVTDTVNFLTSLDLPTVDTLIDSANILREKFYAHITSPTYHGASDISIPVVPAASNLLTAKQLTKNISRFLNIHGSNGSLHQGDIKIWSSVPTDDVIVLNYMGCKDGNLYDVSLDLNQSFFEPNIYGFYSTEKLVSSSFIGVADSPSLASALPIPAVSLYRNNPGYTTDAVEIFFNKPMDITSDLSSIIISGGPIIIKGKTWTSDFSAEINVASMSGIPYTISATGLLDKFGNQVL
jgi:hypothetical protein